MGVRRRGPFFLSFVFLPGLLSPLALQARLLAAAPLSPGLIPTKLHGPAQGGLDAEGWERKRPPPLAVSPWALHYPGIINAEGLDKVRHLVGGANNECGPTRLKMAAARVVDFTDALIFIVFLSAGLVPPFSSFFHAVLEHFQVHMLHLHPNMVLVLAMFAHLCEAFVGVMPSL